MPLRSAVDFYKHDRGWANRLVAGDSLLVMNSLLQKEGMAGRVQMIYIDPPYGIKYGSNFQPFVGDRRVEDGTWELGIHSYLTYLRDRLLISRDLLSTDGSVFVQISDENLHLVRNLLDEIFGVNSFISVITVKKTGAQTSNLLAPVSDYLVWYAKNKQAFQSKYRPLLKAFSDADSSIGEAYEKGNFARFGQRLFQDVSLTSNRPAKEHEIFPMKFEGTDYQLSANRTWSTSKAGYERLVKANRVLGRKTGIRYVKFADDFPASALGNLWADVAGAKDKVYVVQTNTKVIERCVLMTTDPG
ncbi:site-specific DNA-methyltransferase, partial [bacterium]|nr:site-specific DNA-methyltransferase [bacterium]